MVAVVFKSRLTGSAEAEAHACAALIVLSQKWPRGECLAHVSVSLLQGVEALLSLLKTRGRGL